MTILELKELIRPLSDEDKQELRRMLNEPYDDHPIFHMGEIVSQLPNVPQPPADFAENFRKYKHDRLFRESKIVSSAIPTCKGG